MNGRLSWPFVISILYITVALIIFDYVWRVVVTPFNTLLFYAFVTSVALAILLLGLTRFARWWQRNG